MSDQADQTADDQIEPTPAQPEFIRLVELEAYRRVHGRKVSKPDGTFEKEQFPAGSIITNPNDGIIQVRYGNAAPHNALAEALCQRAGLTPDVRLQAVQSRVSITTVDIAAEVAQRP